ncbi:MAG TPA: hypothetical protein VEB59_10285 [Gemmatimonadales bacterium]|nr:hypothetical protein [Gemmatimonadales bacterium]
MRMTHRAPALLAAALLTGCGEPTAPGPHGSAPAPGTPAAIVAKTKLSIQSGRFLLNGAVTYPGRAAEGKLMNVRMVNSVFEDANRPSFDAAANTEEFVSRMSQYVALGVRGFTVSLQGGYPGYEGARNTAFTSQGALRSGYLSRVARVIERADALGAVVILSLFYQRQDQHLADEKAVRAGVVNAVDWVRTRGYRNVILEVANEYGHAGFDHAVLRSDAGVASLVRLANDRYPALPVSASYLRAGLTTSQVASASDLLLIHLNSVSLSDVRTRIRALRQAHPGKAVVCIEDARTGSAAAAAASASVEAGGSYGLMVEDRNQRYPFYFNGRSDDPTAYDRYVALTQ